MIVDQMALCGADAISVEEKNHIAESHKKIGSDMPIYGNIGGYETLVPGTPEDVENAVKQAITKGISAIWPGCDIWPTAPKDDMKTLVEATRKYGKGG
jgi:[methyl-Co(III) methanol-specific corrinoid protein]:coenzyme M methyltransferase